MSTVKKNNIVFCQYFEFILRDRGGVWYADGRRNNQKLGKYSLGTRDLKEAHNVVHDLDRTLAIEQGVYLEETQEEPQTTKSLSIEEGWQIFYRDRCKDQLLGGVSVSTQKRYRTVGDKFQIYCQQKSVSYWKQVTKSVVEDYGDWLRKKSRNRKQNYADASLCFELSVIRGANHFLVLEKHLSQDLKVSLSIPKIEESTTYCYQQAEVTAILELCQTHNDLRWFHPLVATLAMTGIRIGEAKQLRWSDIDLDGRLLHVKDERHDHRKKKAGLVRTTKGKRSRTIPIHTKLMKILGSLKKHRDGYLFHGPRGGRLKPDVVRTIFVRDVLSKLKEQFPTLSGEAGFEHGRIHSFRHYFVSECFREGIPEPIIMDWVGHRQSRIIARHRHQRPEDGMSKMDSINF